MVAKVKLLFLLSFFFSQPVVCFQDLSTLTSATRLQATGDFAVTWYLIAELGANHTWGAWWKLWVVVLWSHCWISVLPRAAAAALAEGKAGMWLQSVSSPVYKQKVAQEPVWQVAGSSSTTSVAVLCGFTLPAVILTPASGIL